MIKPHIGLIVLYTIPVGRERAGQSRPAFVVNVTKEDGSANLQVLTDGKFDDPADLRSRPDYEHIENVPQSDDGVMGSFRYDASLQQPKAFIAEKRPEGRIFTAGFQAAELGQPRLRPQFDATEKESAEWYEGFDYFGAHGGSNTPGGREEERAKLQGFTPAPNAVGKAADVVTPAPAPATLPPPEQGGFSSEPAPEKSEEFKRGRADFDDGASRDDFPQSYNNPQLNEWQDGWDAAAAEAGGAKGGVPAPIISEGAGTTAPAREPVVSQQEEPLGDSLKPAEHDPIVVDDVNRSANSGVAPTARSLTAEEQVEADKAYEEMRSSGGIPGLPPKEAPAEVLEDKHESKGKKKK